MGILANPAGNSEGIDKKKGKSEWEGGQNMEPMRGTVVWYGYFLESPIVDKILKLSNLSFQFNEVVLQ